VILRCRCMSAYVVARLAQLAAPRTAYRRRRQSGGCAFPRRRRGARARAGQGAVGEGGRGGDAALESGGVSRGQ
jgi:hypothetical protein